MKPRHATTLALALLALTGAGLGGALAPPHDDLALDAANATTTPGNTATVEVSVENTGNETVGGNYALDVNDSALPAGWQTTISNATVVRGPLESNATRTANVSVSVPENATPGDYQLSLALSSGTREWTNTTATIHVVEDSATTTTDSGADDGRDDGDRAMETTAENVPGGGGGAVFAAGGGPSYPSWWPFESFSPKQGLLGLVVLLGLGVGVNRLSD